MQEQSLESLPDVKSLTDAALHGDMARDLVNVVGLSATLKLVEAMGGLNIRIPLGMTAQGQARRDAFVALIGLEATTRLIGQYGGTMLYVPSCRQARVDARDQAINRERNRLASAGCTERRLVDDLARQYGLSSRHIWRILKKPVVPDTSLPSASSTVLLGASSTVLPSTSSTVSACTGHRTR
ncbi:MAG: Mor transcription activator family protein [Bilophila sp.]